MGRKIALLYTVFSILALLVLSVWTTSSLLDTKAHNLASAARRFNALTRDVASTYTSSGGSDTATFRSFVRSLFLSDPTIEVLLVESPEGGLQYLFARHAGYVQNPESIERSWRGSIVYNTTLERLFSAPLPLPGHPRAELQAVYAIFDRASLDSTLRPLLAALLGFVILTGIVIAFVSILRAGRLPAVATEPHELPHGPLGRPEGERPNARSAGAAQEPSYAPQTPPVAPAPAAVPHVEPVQSETVSEERDAAARNDERWSALSEEVVPLELESPVGAAASARAVAPGARRAAEELPPGVVLPTLEEIAAEGVAEVVPTSEALAARGAAPERVAEHDREAPLPASSEERLPSAEDELADIEDYEDLETLDGSPSPEGDEPRRRSSDLPRRPAPPHREPEPSARAESPRQAESAPTSFDLPEEDEEIAELEEIPEEAESPALAARPPADGSAGAPAASKDGDGGLLKRLLAQSASRGAAGRAPAAESSGTQQSAAYSQADRGAPLGLFAPETGLGWSEYFEKRLSFEIDRCASFDQDLSIALMRCNAPIGAEARKELAREILLNFTFQDLCFEYGDDGFAVILPNVDIDGALRKLETFQGRIAEEEERLPGLCIGLAARNGRLLPGARLRSEAESALAKALASTTETIVAVLIDPGLYRRHA